jgi:upstream activation factor subunit UAF30
MSSKVSSSKVTSRTATSKKVQPAVQAPAPAAPVETPKKVAKKAAPVPVPEPVSETTPVVEPVQEDVKKTLATSEDVVSVLTTTIQRLKTEAQNAKSRKDRESVATLNELARNLNSLKKPIDKLARSKPPRKQINIDKNRNGFLKPLDLSPELAQFLGCAPEDKKSRVEVTRAICKYIDEHDLQNPENRREIRVDATLQKLLNYDPAKETDPLQYFMIQTRIQPHFIKKE